MPVMKTLLLSASVLVLALGANAHAAGVPAPDFGQPAGSMAPGVPVAATPASLSPAVPAALAGGGGTLGERRPATPGVNPFAAAPVPAPAAAPASAAATEAFKPDAPPPASSDAGESDAATDADAVDEAALRYYAEQRDLVRVGAEIRRLKALHSDWQPPTDLFADKTAANEGEFWDLMAKRDFAALDAAIAKRAKQTPGWQPSADLSGKLATARSRAAIEAAAARAEWSGVVAAASAHPGALTCANMDMLWSLGEGYARTGNLSRAFDVYAYALKNCDNPAERLATYQKAAALLPPEGAEALAGFGRPLPNGSVEFAGLRFDPLRAVLGKVAAGEPGTPPPRETLEAFAAEIGRSRSQSDAMLFGWYLFAEQDFAGSAEWFKAASQLGSDPKALEGYILSLRNDGQVEEAARLAYASRARSPEIAKIYVEILSGRLTQDDATAVLDEATLRTFAGVVDETRSALGAQSLGWNLLARDKPADARDWFRKSVEWQPTKEGVTGLAVVAARSKDRGELKAVQAQFGDDFPELASLSAAAAPGPARGPARPARQGRKSGGKDAALMAQANAAFKARDYKQALALLEKRGSLYGRNGGAEVLKGWANLKLGRFEEARRVFKAENGRRSTKDTRFGIGAVSNEQYGMWE